MHCDSDWNNCTETGRGETAYVLFMFGACIAWRSIRQPVVALSTAEAEYMALCAGACELLFWIQFFEELGIAELLQPSILQIRSDNEIAVKMCKQGANLVSTRHINRKLHFLKELADRKIMDPVHIPGSTNPSDGLTKGLGKALQTQSRMRLLGHRR